MTARARAVEETRARIVDACVVLYGERPVSDVGLEDVAARAGVSVQTILRHFGTRAGLEEAAIEHARHAVEEERRAPVTASSRRRSGNSRSSSYTKLFFQVRQSKI